MHQDDPGLEQRLSRFEAQLDRFSLALHQWQHTQSQTPPDTPADLDERMRSLEETVSRETQALRRLHEEPLKQLQGHAEYLTEISRNLQALVADLRLNAGSQVSNQGSAANWPLERVVNLHDELRRTATGNEDGQDSLPGDTTQSLTRRVHLLEAAREQEVAPQTVESQPVSRRWVYAASAAGAVVAILLVVVVVRWIEDRLNDASARVASAEQQVLTTTEAANREVAAARQDADRQIAEARQLAQRAETVGVILTAPDLIRFNLTSGETNGSSAQLLWSRTRGLVLSGSRLPAAPPESTYQLWLVTDTQSVGAGLFVPDDAGRATLVVDAPPRVPGTVVGAAVTVEPSGGRTSPTGRTLLARFP
jgi:anti-sigma-K factor RskA